jgi:hypothetical protein
LRKILFYILLSITISGNLAASEITGNAPEYAGSELIFYKYQDRITFMNEEIFRLNIDTAGNFSTNVNVDQITYVFGEFGVYHAYFFLEPDKDYELLLPPFAKDDFKC